MTDCRDYRTMPIEDLEQHAEEARNDACDAHEDGHLALAAAYDQAADALESLAFVRRQWWVEPVRRRLGAVVGWMWRLR